MSIPVDPYTVTATSGATIGHIWPGPWARPYTPADGRATAWFARSVHDHADDPFLHDFSSRAQAEQFLRARHVIANRADHETLLLAHPERRATGHREVRVYLEGAEDQLLPALFTYDGPRFRSDVADIAVAVINRGYHDDHEQALAYRDGTTITVIHPNAYADHPDYQPDQYLPDSDGRYVLLPDAAWRPVNGEDPNLSEPR
ncbi:hypothetical protein L3Q67_26670 [Saccharothrix sp. AJ9571]|nr:hypothetical protein L3Q67_26670 [Saccharothrix sp. AJ9571]